MRCTFATRQMDTQCGLLAVLSKQQKRSMCDDERCGSARAAARVCPHTHPANWLPTWRCETAFRPPLDVAAGRGLADDPVPLRPQPPRRGLQRLLPGYRIRCVLRTAYCVLRTAYCSVPPTAAATSPCARHHRHHHRRSLGAPSLCPSPTGTGTSCPALPPLPCVSSTHLY